MSRQGCVVRIRENARDGYKSKVNDFLALLFCEINVLNTFYKLDFFQILIPFRSNRNSH